MKKPTDFLTQVRKFIGPYEGDQNGRYHSYDHIRKAFLHLRDDVAKGEETKKDTLALHLFAYLASWGMLRNSFLLQKDYKFLYGVVELLCKKDYEGLTNYNPIGDNDEETATNIVKLIKELKREIINTKYWDYNETDEEMTETYVAKKTHLNTLVTKVLLGTHGCIVAYDNNARAGLDVIGCPTKSPNKDSIKYLIEFAKANKDNINKVIETLNKLPQPPEKGLYTPMKIIDMYLFEAGFAKILEKKKEKESNS